MKLNQANFISMGSFQLIFLNLRYKVHFSMSRSFATQALSRTATFQTKQSTISTQNTFPVSKLSLPIWSLALKIR